jgi:hypothetical protein
MYTPQFTDTSRQAGTAQASQTPCRHLSQPRLGSPDGTRRRGAPALRAASIVPKPPSPHVTARRQRGDVAAPLAARTNRSRSASRSLSLTISFASNSTSYSLGNIFPSLSLSSGTGPHRGPQRGLADVQSHRPSATASSVHRPALSSFTLPDREHPPHDHLPRGGRHASTCRPAAEGARYLPPTHT